MLPEQPARGSHTEPLCRAVPCFPPLPPWLPQPPRPLCPQRFAGSQLPARPLLPARWSEPPIKGQLWGPGPCPCPGPDHGPSTPVPRASAPAAWEPGRSPLPCCSAGSPGEGAALPSGASGSQALLSGFGALSVFYGPSASCQGEGALCKPCLFRRSRGAALVSARLWRPQPRHQQAAAAGLRASRARRTPA